MISFGERLQQLRSELGIKQKELEEKSGIQQATLSAYETGRIDPSLKVIIKLAEALGVGIADFFPRENGNHKPITTDDGISPLSKEERELIEDFRGIDHPKEKKHIRDMAKFLNKRS